MKLTRKPITLSTMVLLALLFANTYSCKKQKKEAVNISGSYTLKRTGYSYWCEKYKTTSGVDSIPYFGYYTFKDQPGNILESTAIISKISNTDYSICLEGNCGTASYNSQIKFENDSVDFGSGFNVFGELVTVRKMKGVQTKSGFKGDYIEYTEQPVRTSSNPHSHIFIGTFELIKK